MLQTRVGHNAVHWLMVTACMLCMPLLAAGGERPAAKQPTATQRMPNAPVVDVALQADGLLTGQVLDGRGRPLAEATVTAQRAGKTIAQTQTDPRGLFRFTRLHSGQYRLLVANRAFACRAWGAGTAPPSAQPAILLLVADPRELLGQDGPVASWMTNPWVITGIVAVAVAVPVAIYADQQDREREPSSP